VCVRVCVCTRALGEWPGFVHDAIRRRRAVLEAQQASPAGTEDAKARPVFLDIMLMARDSNGHPYSDDDIEEETSTFMFEGHGACAYPYACVCACVYVGPESLSKCGMAGAGQTPPRRRWRGPCCCWAPTRTSRHSCRPR
jgi:hypothetical protein